MMNSKSVNHEELFVSWIAKKTKPAYMYEIRDAIREVDAYCLSKKIITQSLLETVDIVAVRKARNVVEGNKFFRLTHRKKFPKYVEAIRFFESYIKEYIEDSKDNNEVTEESSAVIIEEKTEPDTTGSIETNASASVTPEKAYESPAEMQVEKTHINETEYDVVSVISGDEFSDFDENDKTDASEEISLDESDIVESSTQEVETDNSTELPIEEKVRRVLKKECQKNQFGTTALFVSSRIIGAKLHEVERVLKEVPWAKLRYLKLNCLNKVVFNEVQGLKKAFDNSNEKFASRILDSIVAHYLNFHQCDYVLRSQLCELCGLSEKKMFIEQRKNLLK